MLAAFALVLVCLGVGEVFARLGLLPVPAPVTGLLLLYLLLIGQGRVSDELASLADRLLSVLGMLFVPAGVGVVAYADVLRAEFVSLLSGLVGGTLVTLITTLLFVNFLTSRAGSGAASATSAFEQRSAE